MYKIKKAWMLVIVLIFLLSLLAGCAGTQNEKSEKITIAGSSALLPLAQKAKIEFEEKHPNVTVNISAGGSFTGLTQVANGSVDIGTSDVDVEDYPEYDPGTLVDHVVAVAPFVFIVHPDVTVDSLTQEELKGIFTGKFKNWSELGGPNIKISVIHRALSSGSRAVIKKQVLQGEEFTSDAAILGSNGEVRAAIASTPGAIGYVDAAYLNEDVKPLAYEGVPFTPENVYNGSYPIFAYEHMYTKGQPRGVVKEFLDFVLSEEFQNNTVEKMNFLAISKMKQQPQ